jgi:hypothetical protein
MVDAGAQCATGGFSIRGLDANANNVLEASEVFGRLACIGGPKYKWSVQLGDYW